MKKKLLAVIMTAAMVVGYLTGCGSTAASNGTKESTNASTTETNEDTTVSKTTGKSFKLAVGLPDSGSTMFSLMSNNITTMVGDMGGTVVFQGGVGASTDATIQFVEDQIAAGANGIIFSPPSDAVLTSVCAMCEEAGVYWGITFRTILDQEVIDYITASDYYIGNCYEDEEQAGYQVMADMNERGIKNVAIISQAKGNTTTDRREAGAQQACNELGMKIVAEARALTQASDATKAAESFLSAYSELDAIFVVGTTGAGMHEAVAKAIEDAGKSDSVKLATIDFPDTMPELFEKDCLVSSAGLISWGYDPYIITMILANQCKGTPISEEPVSIAFPMSSINDIDTANTWTERFGDATTLYYDEDFISSTLDKANNPDLTLESLIEIIKKYTSNI
ncbi:MAG TPA: sugar ABC transporter substrate-binding protein [Clostridiales bacterium]|nr:sugar ABC transporter substrate-binding protein [Clostridiales bacterium]